MSGAAIRVRNLSKKYRIGGARSPRTTIGERLIGAVRDLAPRHRASDNTFWALSDVSLDVEKGDVIGFIGPNGAGKSTLLKVLSRITRPTTGTAEIWGRVSSLLEVGTGFHHELT